MEPMEVFIKAAGRAYAMAPTLVHSEVERYLLEYGFKQCLADAAAGKNGMEALKAIQARYDRLCAGDVPKRGDRADSLEAATREVYAQWFRGQAGLKAKDAADAARSQENRAKAVERYVMAYVSKAVNRMPQEWTEEDKARAHAGVQKIHGTLAERVTTLLAAKRQTVEVEQI